MGMAERAGSRYGSNVQQVSGIQAPRPLHALGISYCEIITTDTSRTVKCQPDPAGEGSVRNEGNDPTIHEVTREAFESFPPGRTSGAAFGLTQYLYHGDPDVDSK